MLSRDNAMIGAETFTSGNGSLLLLDRATEKPTPWSFVTSRKDKSIYREVIRPLRAGSSPTEAPS